jgi:hypothetical protein
VTQGLGLAHDLQDVKNPVIGLAEVPGYRRVRHVAGKLQDIVLQERRQVAVVPRPGHGEDLDPAPRAPQARDGKVQVALVAGDVQGPPDPLQLGVDLEPLLPAGAREERPPVVGYADVHPCQLVVEGHAVDEEGKLYLIDPLEVREEGVQDRLHDLHGHGIHLFLLFPCF